MEDWAESAAERRNEDERIGALNAELKVEQLRRSKHFGPKLIKSVHLWLHSQAEKFNELRGREEMEVSYTLDTYRSKTGNRDHEICVKWVGLKRPSLTIRYSEIIPAFTYECEADSGSFALTVSDEGQWCLTDSGNCFSAVPAFGSFLLKKFERQSSCSRQDSASR